MSDQIKRARSVVNPLKVLNQLRQQNGLPKAAKKAKAITISAEVKNEIAKQEFERLYPAALSDKDFIFTDDMGQKVVKEVEIRIARIKSGKEAAPAVAAPAPKAPRPEGAPRPGRKPGTGLKPKTIGKTGSKKAAK